MSGEQQAAADWMWPRDRWLSRLAGMQQNAGKKHGRDTELGKIQTASIILMR